MSKFQPESRAGQSLPADQSPLPRRQLLTAVAHLEQVVEMQLSLLQAIRMQLDSDPPAAVVDIRQTSP
ncbi:MAG: hypothetical protein KDA90_01740 [Planctomycetaceae bacterium]|nr:hypothetical protein [Planctomycetaceae bacterium]